MTDGIANTLRAEGPPEVSILPGMNRPYPARRDDPGTGPGKGPNLRLFAVLTRAKKRFQQAITAESANRTKATLCLRFKASDQWEPDLAAQRAAARRPKLTVNKIVTFVNQVANDQRQNRPATMISPAGDRGHIDLAHMLRGLIRVIERDSDAELAYDTSFESALDIGWGYWRYNVEWDGDTFRKRIVIEPIHDTMAVYLDPDAKRPEGSDAKWAFVTQWIPRDEFRREYPGVSLSNWESGAEGDRYRNWGDDESIRIAEYFEIETQKRTLVMLANGHVGWEDELSDDVVWRSQEGDPAYQIVNEREVDTDKVMWYKMIADQVIDEEEWLGAHIPIVRDIYERINQNGKTRYVGIIERMLDPQRMYNYWVSAETEALALAPKAPWVLAEGQDAGYEDEYQSANLVPNPVIHYRPVSIEGHPVPAPQRQQPVAVQAGFQAAKQGAAADMMTVSGIRFDSTPQERTYDESGQALRELQRVSDLGSFHGVDNLTRSLRRGGEILLDLIPRVYDTAQVLTIIGEDDKERMVRIDPNAPQAVGKTQGPDGSVIPLFNPRMGKYSVAVTVGPSARTRRIETANQIMQFIKAVPQAAPLIMDLLATYLDWPGADQIAQRLATAVPPQALAPAEKDVSPQVAALIQNLQFELQQAKQQLMGAMQALQEKQSDRALLADKYEKDFEAKVLAIVQKAEQQAQKMQATAGSQFKDMVEATKMIEEGLTHPREAA